MEMLNIEKNYNKKIEEALRNENDNEMINLMFELNVLKKLEKQKKKKSNSNNRR
jgi:hypothetical protein